MATYNGTAAANSYTGTASADTIYGNGGNDTLYGAGGIDFIDGGADNDYLYGDGGDDFLYGKAGADFIRGGTGNDNIGGGDGNDTIYGDAGSDIISGDDGNDSFFIFSGDGVDTILGGGGDDKIVVNTAISGSSYVIEMGYPTGVETLEIAHSAQNLILQANGSMTLTDFKYIIGFSEKLQSVLGGVGNDTIQSFDIVGVNETIDGLDGNDSLYGYKGNETIYGNVGADTLVGGEGNDTLTGGSGIDNFQFNAAAAVASEGYDVITDFVNGTDKFKFINSSGYSYASLTITANGADVDVSINQVHFKIQNVALADIDSSDFIFA